MASTPAVHVTRDRFHLAWDPATPPIETVPSGSIVTFDLLDASGGQLTARLCSVAIDLRISEIVDVPNYVVTAHCPLSIFD